MRNLGTGGALTHLVKPKLSAGLKAQKEQGATHKTNERTFFGETQTRVHGRRYTDARACRGTMGRLGSGDRGRAVAPKNAMSGGECYK